MQKCSLLVGINLPMHGTSFGPYAFFAQTPTIGNPFLALLLVQWLVHGTLVSNLRLLAIPNQHMEDWELLYYHFCCSFQKQDETQSLPHPLNKKIPTSFILVNFTSLYFLYSISKACIKQNPYQLLARSSGLLFPSNVHGCKLTPYQRQ